MLQEIESLFNILKNILGYERTILKNWQTIFIKQQQEKKEKQKISNRILHIYFVKFNSLIRCATHVRKFNLINYVYKTLVLVRY